MFKRFITVLASTSIIASASSSVVSCVAPAMANGEDGQRVVLVTGGILNDHSFNETTYNGLKKLLKDSFNNEADKSYVETANASSTAIEAGYKLGLVKGANLLVAPGFEHINPLINSESFLDKTNVILLDSKLIRKNIISITFNSQIAGFLAGFNSSMWATSLNKNGELNGDANGDKEIIMGTFMGSSNKYSVDNYGWGMILGMQVYNEMASRYNAVSKSNIRTLVKTANDQTLSIANLYARNTTDSNFYTNSFNLGDATKNGMVPLLVDTRKADIVFPIAGPQTEDVISHKTHWSNGGKPYIIGVDTDATKSFPAAAKERRFLTSAIKDLSGALNAAAYRAESDSQKNTLAFSKETLEKENPKQEKWLGTNPEPFASWSTAITNADLKRNNESPLYKIDDSYIKLFNDENKEEVGKGIISEINYFYNSLGTNPSDYFKGSVFTSFAKELVDKYGMINFNTDNKIDWTK